MSNNDTFQWTDELVRDFIRKRCGQSDGFFIRFNELVESFKASHTQQEPERVQVAFLRRHVNGRFSHYEFSILNDGNIPEEKFPSIKDAIEKVLNDDAPKPGIDLPKDFVEMKNIAVMHNDGRREELIMYTQSEIDNARKEGFEAGQLLYRYPDFANFKYRTYEDYLNHIKQPTT